MVVFEAGADAPTSSARAVRVAARAANAATRHAAIPVAFIPARPHTYKHSLQSIASITVIGKRCYVPSTETLKRGIIAFFTSSAALL